jgi:hypothetical protein
MIWHGKATIISGVLSVLGYTLLRRAPSSWFDNLWTAMFLVGGSLFFLFGIWWIIKL